MKRIYNPPLFYLDHEPGDSYASFLLASDKVDKPSIDYTTVLSALALGQAPSNRTIINEVVRDSWVKDISDDFRSGELRLFGTEKYRLPEMADIFIKAIEEEIKVVCSKHSTIHLLLTGGLDSRLYAAVLNDLVRKEEVTSHVYTYTWGLEDSRDVVYAQRIAAKYDWEWTHIPLSANNVLENITVAVDLGLLHSPEMLHSMPRLHDYIKSPGAVIAVSFGDSIGRGEFSNLHLLELRDKRRAITNPFGLFSKEAYPLHRTQLEEDITRLYNLNGTIGNLPSYVKNELWMQGFRMRNGLCHAMTIFAKNKVEYYQGMTSYNIVSFIWSLHPAFRGDKMYEYILGHVFTETLDIPWARNNKLITGARVRNDYKPAYHNYSLWSANELFDYTESLVLSSEITNSGYFDNEALKLLRDKVARSSVRVGRINDIWLYLSSLSLAMQRFSDSSNYNFELSRTYKGTLENKGSLKNSIKVKESRSKVIIVDALKKIRSLYRVLRREIIKKYWRIKF
jgi:hypothetical protein